MSYFSKEEKILMDKIFKIDAGEILFHSNLPRLLLGKGSSNDTPTFVPVKLAPNILRKKMTEEVCNAIFQHLQLSGYQSLVESLTFESFFISRLKELFQTNGLEEGYRDYQSIYADFDFLSAEKVIELSMLHAMIVLIWRFTYDVNKLRFIYEHLLEGNYGVEIPLTSFESFQKYLYRKRLEGLPKGIIHGLYDQPSNNRELTQFMKDLLILLATNYATLQSAFSVKEDLDYLLETMPGAKACGVYSVSHSKITNFLKEPESRNLISYAKDNSTEFRRNVIGVMRFLRASAPLIRIYIDGYMFQVEYKNNITKKPDRLTGVFISDDYSDYIISHEIGDSENYELLMKALEGYFKKTGNSIPREIVVDKYTYKILAKNKAFISLLKRHGIEKGKGLIVSSNANRKSRLERFFLTFQQKFMNSIIHYIGPSITARRTNSHPFREFRIYLQKNLPDEFDLTLVLNKLIKIHYNKDYVSPSQINELSTPEYRFNLNDPNPLCSVSEDIARTIFYELHRVTFKAGAVMIRKGDSFVLFFKRDFHFINDYNQTRIDAYIKPNDPGKVFIYELETTNFITEIDMHTIIPVAAFDRTDEHKKIAHQFNKQTQELISLFEEEFKSMEETVFTALNGRDFRLYTKLAKMKKEKSIEQDLAESMNLLTPKEDLTVYHSNKRRNRTKSISLEEQIGITITDTF